MKKRYIEPVIDIFVFYAKDTIVASSVLPTEPKDSSLAEDVIGVADGDGTNFVF